jgi:hypothetical protein
VTDIGLASVLMDLFITVEDVGAVVARTRKTGTSEIDEMILWKLLLNEIYLD